MKVIEKNEGAKIPYEVKGTKIVFNDDELTLNLSRYERDDVNHIDICRDRMGNLVSGVIPGVAETYVAQIDIWNGKLRARRRSRRRRKRTAARREEWTGRRWSGKRSRSTLRNAR